MPRKGEDMNERYDHTNAMLTTDEPNESTSDGGGWNVGGEMDQTFAMETPGAGGTGRINQGMLLVGLVPVVAAGALFAMRMGGSASIDRSLADVELKIETALAQLGVQSQSIDEATGRAAGPADTAEVIAMFTSDPAAKQVPLNQLRRNPFALGGRTATTDRPDPQPTPTMSLADRQREKKLNQLRDELSRLQLTTVMNGRVPLAVISGKVVRQGERIGSFSVVTIQARTVTLAADGNTYRLMMDQPRVNPTSD